MMKSYKREEYLKCPNCGEELTQDKAEDHAVIEGEFTGSMEEHECYECYQLFYVQYNKHTSLIDVSIDEK
ncbi:hypothetical protein VP193E371_P0210 [Vibrio phage 193E37-1]|nr:hypothetical protein VP193E371_P0210 [Vibrio phage 193E37-1]